MPVIRWRPLHNGRRAWRVRTNMPPLQRRLAAIPRKVRPSVRSFSAFVLLTVLPLAASARAGNPFVYNVRHHGAAGDGKTLDSTAINKAIDACAAAGGGEVLVPPGK